MKKGLRHTLALCAFSLSTALAAQNAPADSTAGISPQWSFAASAGAGYNIGSSSYGNEYIRSNFMGHSSLAARYQPDPAGRNPYDRAYGSPTFEFGLLLADYSHVNLNRGLPDATYDSNLGLKLAAYAAFHRDLLRAGKWRAGYILENGVGYCSHPYDAHTNADNHFTGAHAAIYVGLGLYGGLQLTPRWNLGLDLYFKHFSNGALARPNKGVNSVSAAVKAVYTPRPAEVPGDETDEFRPKTAFKKQLYADLSVGTSARSLEDIWNYYESQRMASKESSGYHSGRDLYISPTLSVALMYRYRLRYASGLAFDYTYATYTDATRRWEAARGIHGMEHNPNILGVALRHEVFYRDISLKMSLGYKLYRKTGYMQQMTEKPVYETVGLRWYPARLGRRFYIGYQVKAHYLKADCMQLYLGWHIGKKKSSF